MTPEVTPQQEDWMEKRTESIVQVFNNLLLEHTAKTVDAVKVQVKETVNGSITSFRAEINERLDKQDEVLQRLDTDTKPLIKTKKWTIEFVNGLKIVAIWITAIGGAYLVLTNIFK